MILNRFNGSGSAQRQDLVSKCGRTSGFHSSLRSYFLYRDVIAATKTDLQSHSIQGSPSSRRATRLVRWPLLQRRHLLQQQLQDDVDTRFYWNTGVAVQFLRMLSHNSCITLIEACCVFLLLYFQWGGGGGGRRISIKLQCLSRQWPVLIVQARLSIDYLNTRKCLLSSGD